MASKPRQCCGFLIMMVICFGFILVTGCGLFDDDDDHEVPDSVSLVILQTSDLHHHAAGYGPQLDYTPLDGSDGDSVLGGYARLSGLIRQIRSEAEAAGKSVLLVDSGDFLMGTIYDLTAADPIAFAFFDAMEYDAITLGNHEFDWGNASLYDLIEAGRQSGFDIPIIASNLQTNPTDGGDDDIETLVAAGIIVESELFTMDGDVTVGVLGIMGSDAESYAPLADPVVFNHGYAFLQGKVDALRASGADVVVLLSHTGVIKDGSGEDADIAENVTGIDIIASGHEHTATTTAFVKGDSGTIIFSPGEYGSYLSRLDITYSKQQQKITSYAFELMPVDDTVAGDEEMDTMVYGYQSVLNAQLSDLGVGADDIVSKTEFDLTLESMTETGFGNLVADAIRQSASDLDTVDNEPYAVGVIVSGVIRDNIYRGKTGMISFSDVYNAVPLGSSPYDDSAPGYPMMSVYVTAPEIRNICEISISAAPVFGGNYYINVSGVRYDYQPSNDFLQKVTDVYLSPDMNTTGSGTKLDLNDTTTLYHLVVNLYALSMMDVVTSVGLDIIPKDKNGDPVSTDDYADLRIDASTETGVQELKEWMALEHFLKTYYPSSAQGIPAAVYGKDGAGLNRANEVVAP